LETFLAILLLSKHHQAVLTENSQGQGERPKGKKEKRGGKGKGAYARMQEEEDARIEREWSTSVRGNNARDWHESCNPSSQGNTPPLLLLLAIAPPCFTTKHQTLNCSLEPFLPL
jgi:hypothetical protein